jgi:hypothetical protein
MLFFFLFVRFRPRVLSHTRGLFLFAFLKIKMRRASKERGNDSRRRDRPALELAPKNQSQ